MIAADPVCRLSSDLKESLSADEIAAVAGYDNLFFRRLFKRSTGLTPGAYRRMFKPMTGASDVTDAA